MGKSRKTVSKLVLDKRRDTVKRILLAEERKKFDKQLGIVGVVMFFFGAIVWQCLVIIFT